MYYYICIYYIWMYKERGGEGGREREQPLLGQTASKKQSFHDSGNRDGDLEDCHTAAWSGGAQDPEAPRLLCGTRQQ